MLPSLTPASPRTAAAGDETSILLVAPQALVRAGLRALLNARPGFVVLAEACDLEQAVTLSAQHRPEVVLVSAVRDAGLDRTAIASIRANAPDACVLFLGNAGDTEFAIDCLADDAGVDEFCAAVGALRRGACAACAVRSRCPVPMLTTALSRRERQVAVAVAAGMSSKQIAGALGIGLRTVNTYRESLARKVGASSPAVLTRFVIESGLELVTG